MIFILRYFFILSLIVALGCQSAQMERPMEPTGTVGQPSRLTFSNEIKERIHFLNVLLEKNDLSEGDRKIAEDLLSTYRGLQELSSSQATEADHLRVIHELFNSVSAMDKKYFSRQVGKADDYSKTISLFAKKRADILDAYISGDFNTVIDLCIELKTVFGPDALIPDIGLLFALSLAKKGMFSEAINIGEGIARELETSPDIVQLRAGIAEWYLRLGQREEAVRVHEKLVDTLDEKGIEVLSLSRKIEAAEKTGSADGRIPARVQSQNMEERNVDQILEEAEKLLEANRFGEARELLMMTQYKVLSKSEAESVKQALKKLETAEEYYLEEKISMISTKRDMEQARRLLEEEKYEEVIARLDAIEADEFDRREIKALKEFAIEKLINRERNRAAKIFLDAKETRDPVIKEKYLLEALDILNPLIEKYPLSPLNQKLISNAKTVEEELAKLKTNSEDRGGWKNGGQ